MIKFLREPHAKQLQFIDLNDPEQCYGGAKRGGKTICLGMKVGLLAYWFPGNRILCARKALTDFKDTTLIEMLATIPPEMILDHNKNDRKLVLKSRHAKYPSEVIYRGLGDVGGQDWEKIKSMSLGAFAIDEPSEIGLDVYLQLRSQLTWTLPRKACEDLLDLQPSEDGLFRPAYMGMLFTNPEPGWVKDRFVDPENRPPGCAFVQALPSDNPFLPPGYVEELMQAGYPPEWIAKYMRGDWSAGEGQVFPMYHEEYHELLKPVSHDVLKHGNWVGALDHGMAGVTAATLFNFDPYGNEVCVAEYWERDRLISQHAREIKNMWMEFGCRPSMLIDPSTLARTLQGTNELESVIDEYARNGVICVPAWNKIEVGYDSMKEVLTRYTTHFYPSYHHLKGPNAPAAFFVKDRTPHLRKEIQGMRKIVKADGSVTWSGVDHALDTWRYVRNSRPRRPQLAPTDLNHMNSADRLMHKTHSKWVDSWDKKTSPHTGTFWHPGR
jgi:hypothetical protein